MGIEVIEQLWLCSGVPFSLHFIGNLTQDEVAAKCRMDMFLERVS